MATDDLETLLVRSQFIRPDQLEVARHEAVRRHRRLAPVLVDLGIVDELRFAEWMSQMTSIPIVDPIPAAAVEPLVARIPRAIAREYEVLPIKIDPATLTIATINPLDPRCMEVLHLTTRLNIRPMIALHSAIKQLLSRFYGEENAEQALMAGDESLGSTTRVVRDIPKPPSQLDRIEVALHDLRRMVSKLQERLESIEESLEHILSRR